MTNSFTYKDVKYYEDNGKYFKIRYGKKLSVSKKEFYKLKKKANADSN